MKTGGRVAALLLLVVASQAGRGDILPQPTLAVTNHAAVVSNLVPGSRVALIGYGRAHFGGVSTRRFYHWEVLEDSDRDGRIERALPDLQAPELTVWVAYVSGSGELIGASGSGSAPVLFKDASDLTFAADALELESVLEIQILLRPGPTLWVWNGKSQGARIATTDGEALRAVYTTTPDSFVAASDETPSFPSFAPGDLLLSIHQLDMTLTARYAQ